jgi:hypothetical protein
MFTEKYEIFWTNIASTMACPNFKNGPKNGLGPLGIKGYLHVSSTNHAIVNGFQIIVCTLHCLYTIVRLSKRKKKKEKKITLDRKNFRIIVSN